MKSTIEQFMINEKPQFKTISEQALARIEEALFKAIQESLKRQLVAKEVATETVPWGTYTATCRKGSNGGNVNIEFAVNADMQEALEDQKNSKAMYQDDFSEEFTKLFDEYVMYGEFFADEDDAKKKDSSITKGVNMTDFQKEYFPNSYGLMLLKAARDHRADGELYQIILCDTVRHGTLEFEYNGDKVSVKFTPDKAFKQYLKNDEAADGSAE